MNKIKAACTILLLLMGLVVFAPVATADIITTPPPLDFCPIGSQMYCSPWTGICSCIATPSPNPDPWFPPSSN